MVAIIAVLATASIWYWHSRVPAATAAITTPPIPVDTAAVSRSDVPIYLEGLGTVQAFNTVTVTTRVDGQMQSIKFSEGQDVNAGDVLAQIDQRPYQATLDQAVATKAKDEATLANAKLDLQRYTTLVRQDSASKQTFDTQKALVAQLEAQVQMDQAAIDSAKTNLDYTAIRSPIDGRTGIREVDAGNNLLAASNTPIVVITQMRPISVVFTLPEEDLPQVSNAMAAGPLTAIAVSRDGKTELDRGTLAVLDNEIVQATGTLKLKATFPNANEKLWPGNFVNVRLLVETEKNVVTIPSTAVQRGPNGVFAYVVRPDRTVSIRPIAVQQFAGGTAVVENGLQAGETVVSAGQYRLQDGAQIETSGTELANSIPGPMAGPGRSR
ncbi:MAG TPA: efflux RND transporter periplasmic adaptor subunit [Bradyrhizobium sp.]